MSLCIIDKLDHGCGFLSMYFIYKLNVKSMQLSIKRASILTSVLFWIFLCNCEFMEVA